MAKEKDKPDKNTDAGPKEVVIHIDHDRFRVEVPAITGAALRQLPNPDVPADRDIYKEVPGGADRKVLDSDTIPVRNGQQFFTAPSTITPG